MGMARSLPTRSWSVNSWIAPECTSLDRADAKGGTARCDSSPPHSRHQRDGGARRSSKSLDWPAGIVRVERQTLDIGLSAVRKDYHVHGVEFTATESHAFLAD